MTDTRTFVPSVQVTIVSLLILLGMNETAAPPARRTDTETRRPVRSCAPTRAFLRRRVLTSRFSWVMVWLTLTV